MFLYDKLLEIGRSIDNETEIVDKLSDMVQECFKSIDKQKSNDMQSIIAQFKRVDNTWRKVAKQLDSEGIIVIEENGFKNFVKHHPKFKELFDKF